MRIILPYLYCILMGSAAGKLMKRDFSSSLAPAFFAHIILTIISGLVFNSLTIGLIIGIGLAILILITIGIRECAGKPSVSAGRLWKSSDVYGILIFTIFFGFCAIDNIGKRFLYWDEFSHWGQFLKESLRLDKLYCTSELTFAHKDYVPAMSIFEYIWCKLCGPFLEENAYTAIQILMFSTILPVVSLLVNTGLENTDSDHDDKAHHKLWTALCACVLLVAATFVFCSKDGFRFFHSIYCDMGTGLIFFYCIYRMFRPDNNKIVWIVELTLACMVLVMSKMIAMALLGMLIVLYLILYPWRDDSKKHMAFLGGAAIAAIPVSIWLWFNRFVDIYVPNVGGTQSYDGLSVKYILDVLFGQTHGGKDYFAEYSASFIKALFSQPVVSFLPYVFSLVLLFAGIVLISRFSDAKERCRIIIFDIWGLVFGILYALMFYCLYLLSFDEYEALMLASFERYMNSYLIAYVLMAVAMFCTSIDWRKKRKAYYIAVLSVSTIMLLLNPVNLKQVIPGFIIKDTNSKQVYLEQADVINKETSDDDKVYVVRRGDNFETIWHLRFYCNPRVVDGGSVGPALYSGDIWSMDKAPEAFREELLGYDCIFFSHVDEVFMNKYGELFETESGLDITDGTVYSIRTEKDKILLAEIISNAER